MNHDLPQRLPGAPRIPRYPTTLPSAALLIRVAARVDEWAERGQIDQGATKHV